jgi:hypothetical protein
MPCFTKDRQHSAPLRGKNEDLTISGKHELTKQKRDMWKTFPLQAKCHPSDYYLQLEKGRLWVKECD